MVILPHKNEKDLRDIPEEIRKQLKLVLADNMEQVLDAALRRRPRPLKTETVTVGGAPGGGSKGAVTRVRRSPFPGEQPPVVVQGR
jgi:hypothetical protein